MQFDIYTDMLSESMPQYHKMTIEAENRDKALDKYFADPQLQSYTDGNYKYVVTRHGKYVYSIEEYDTTDLDNASGSYYVVHVVPAGEDKHSCDPADETGGIYIHCRKTHLILYFSHIKNAEDVLSLIRKLTGFSKCAHLDKMYDFEARAAVVRYILQNGGFIEEGQDDAMMLFLKPELFAESADCNTEKGAILMPKTYKDPEFGTCITYEDPFRVYENMASIDADNELWSVPTLAYVGCKKDYRSDQIVSSFDFNAFAAGPFNCDWDKLISNYKMAELLSPYNLPDTELVFNVRHS